jgi:hypothetical protein
VRFQRARSMQILLLHSKVERDGNLGPSLRIRAAETAIGSAVHDSPAYGITEFDSGHRHFLRPSSRVRRKDFSFPGGFAAVIHCPPGQIAGAVMVRDEKGFRIGFFGDVRREEAGALFERVVETGSLVLRQVGGNRAGEMAAHRFLSSRM